MWDIDTNLYEAWDELDRLYEATNSMKYETAKDIIANAKTTEGDTKKELVDLMTKLCGNTSLRGASPQNWPYQFQLMYNSYILEIKARDILNDITKDKTPLKKDSLGGKITGFSFTKLPPSLAEVNKWLKKYKLSLPKNENWDFTIGEEQHNMLTASSQNSVNDVIDLTNKMPGDSGVAKVEVKGTVGSVENARSFHGAKLAIIFVFSSRTKQRATPWLSVIEDNIATKAKSIKLYDRSIPVDCIEVTVSDPAIPSVDQLVLNDKPVNKNAIKSTPELTSDITDQVSL